jgi:hypothetical protein
MILDELFPLRVLVPKLIERNVSSPIVVCVGAGSGAPPVRDLEKVQLFKYDKAKAGTGMRISAASAPVINRVPRH